MQIGVISDIHANLSALNSTIKDCFKKYGDKIKFIHLGDCIDYGMRPNEVIGALKALDDNIIVSIKGNHERALFGFECERFSSKRGLEANNYTKAVITGDSLEYIKNFKDSYYELEVSGKKILVIHGDLDDIYWGKMNDDEILNPSYLNYDYVISGHTHIPSLRNVINKEKTKKTIFINPGSVGQPRNLNPKAQYCVIDFSLDTIKFEGVRYDILSEQKLYDGNIDNYYKERLLRGI